MTEKILSTNNLISCVKSSYMLDFISSAQVWFTHINLSLITDSMIPDNDCIADQLITFYDLEKFQYCLILIESKRNEHWTEKKGPVPFQSLIEVELKKRKNNPKINNLKSNSTYFRKYQLTFWSDPPPYDDALMTFWSRPSLPIWSVS